MLDAAKQETWEIDIWENRIYMNLYHPESIVHHVSSCFGIAINELYAVPTLEEL